LWIALQNDKTLESLLNKAQQLERKYEWLHAASVYEKAVDLAVAEKKASKAAELQERMGLCFYTASFQAETSAEFRKRLKRAIEAYERGIKLLEDVTEENSQARSDHANAFVAYARFWLETSPFKKKELLDRSYALDTEVLSAYERVGDLHSVGKLCNHLMNYLYERFWIASGPLERVKITKESLKLAEKAIQALSKINDDSELAEAYRYAAWSSPQGGMRTSKEISQKCQTYVKKALELSKKTGDARLISWVNMAAWNTAQNCNFNILQAIKHAEQVIRHGIIAKDNYCIGMGSCFSATSLIFLSKVLEDPEKQKESLEKAKESAIQAIQKAKIFDYAPIFFVAYPIYANALTGLASIETDLKTKQALFERAIKVNKEGVEHLKHWKGLTLSLFLSLSDILRIFSETKSETEEKRKLLHEAQTYINKYVAFFGSSKSSPLFQSMGQHNLALVQKELAKIETNSKKKKELLNKALASLEKSIEQMEQLRKISQTDWTSGSTYGPYYGELGGILQQLHSLTKEEEQLRRAIEAYKKAAFDFKKADLPTHVAESHWHTAQLHGQLGDYHEASKTYELAAESYDLASKKIHQLAKFYRNYSLYMRAWSQIEQARYAHSIEDYDKAKEHYKRAAELHQSAEPWRYLAPNYQAWAKVEEAESLSRQENSQQAKQTFQKAHEQFDKAEESIKQKVEEITSDDEKEMTQRLFEASGFRRKYCQARILMEKAKLLDGQGKFLESSKKYGKAAQKISAITKRIDDEAERKELEYIAILCQAWEKMALAEEATSSEAYLEAAVLFEQAKDHCYTRKASLWALGNSNFCRGLAAGAQYQTRLELVDHAKAKSFVKNASTNYAKAGFKAASEYAKATQRLFDAYLFMNQAEIEADQEKRAKKYQMAENMLQIAAGSFMKAKQPEKTAKVEEILATVREEKALAVSLNQVMKAPSIASTTQSFTAPTPTNEMSVGLENFEHANVQANLVTHVKEVKVGESFCLSIEFVNAGREPALLTRVEDFVPLGFMVVKKPEIYRIEESCLNMKGKQLAPLKLVEVKLTLQASKKGKYQLNPMVHYLDELGKNKSLQLKSLEIAVEEVYLEDRVSTGTTELDSLLLGGIPNEYAVVLTGSPSDEREYLIRNFLEAGTKDDEIIFYVSTEAEGLENLLEKPNFILFLCNPKPKTQVPDLPNVYKLRSKTDLTNLSISLAKAYRNIESSSKKRICVEVVSDVLISHKAETTRRWISEIITDLGAKGFTILAVIDPLMHAPEELHAVLNLFDGEINLTETEDPLECKKSIRVKKLRNQDYIKNPICITT
jgi:KaiC/GvpD/RAD55 family RecA-like ATPase/tetratricopeptide (TPR) repeat protein